MKINLAFIEHKEMRGRWMMITVVLALLKMSEELGDNFDVTVSDIAIACGASIENARNQLAMLKEIGWLERGRRHAKHYVDVTKLKEKCLKGN